MRRTAKTAIIASIIAIFIIATRICIAPPAPVSIAGTIFYSDGATQVPLGTSYMANNTNNSFLIRSQTSNPVPGQTGRYFETLSGIDGDIAKVTAWNQTHLGWTKATLKGRTSPVNVIINTSRPAEARLAIIYPPNSTARNSSYSYNVTAGIFGLGNYDSTGCNATILIYDETTLNLTPGQTYRKTAGAVPKGTTVQVRWEVQGKRESATSIRAWANCSSDTVSYDKMASDTVYSIATIDTTNPIVMLESPKNNSWSKAYPAIFYYNATDHTGIQNCTIYVDSLANETDTTVQMAKRQNFTLNWLSQGNHTWKVLCTDNSTAKNRANSTTYLLRYDTIKPIVTGIWPEDEHESINNTVIFRYKVNDTNPIANCSLIINNNHKQTNYTIEKETVLNFTQYFRAGRYEWEINCTDKAGNTNTSGKRHINITDPDLAISQQDIKLFPQQPVEGQNVTINITVHNFGDEDATEATVEVREGTQTIIYSTIINLPKRTNTTITTSWIAKIGMHTITALADTPIETNGSISEWNEKNNKANRSVYVAMWQIFYGNLFGELMLDTISNRTIVKWSNASMFKGNVYVTDSDSSISWAKLQALGKNKSNQTELDDFEQADISLNSTHLNDSINRTFLFNGQIKAKRNFLVYDMNITGVATVNTSSSQNFFTGILWDTNDLAIGNYNGTQDLVFVANAEDNTEGSFGTYDYELRIPARMREYTKPNDKNTITFYIELW